MNSQKNAVLETYEEASQLPPKYVAYISKEKTTKLYIKCMISFQSRLIVKEEMEKLGIHYIAIELGMVEILEDISEEQREHLREDLLKSGLELLEDKKGRMIEGIKNVIIEMIHYPDDIPNINYSDYISDKLHYDYTYLSNLFSKVKGITIQQFIILSKIERIKELLLCDDLTLTEISYKLHYSSAAHLSNQFKKITGVSPSFYKKLTQKRQGVLNA